MQGFHHPWGSKRCRINLNKGGGVGGGRERGKVFAVEVTPETRQVKGSDKISKGDRGGGEMRGKESGAKGAKKAELTVGRGVPS